MDRNTPGLDQATHQQLVEIDQDNRIKVLEDKQINLVSDIESIRKMVLNATESLNHLLNSFNAIKDRVTALEKKPKKGQLENLI